MSHLLKKREDIISWLIKYNINDYDLVADQKYGFVVNVFSDVEITYKKLVKIMVKFNIVEGSFILACNQLITLEGCPKEVQGVFNVYHNKLKDLNFCPSKITGAMEISNNNLTSLKGCPSEIGGYFSCAQNKLTTLEEMPSSKINGNFDCSKNNLISLKGVPKVVNGNFNCSENELINLQYGPEIVTDSYYANSNKLESLIFLPNQIGINNNGKYMGLGRNPLLEEVQRINQLSKLRDKQKLDTIIKNHRDLNNQLTEKELSKTRRMKL